MYDERIDQHAGFIEALEQRKFNMGIVACIGPKVQCVSAACAMGWTPTTFPELVRWAFDDNEIREFRKKDKTHSYPVAIQWREDPEINDADAMVRLFDITEHEASVLFGAGFSGYTTAQQVAKGLRFFAKTRILPNMEEYLDMLRKEQKAQRQSRRVRSKEVAID